MSRLIITIQEDDDAFDTGLGVMPDPEHHDAVLLPFRNRMNAIDCLRITAHALEHTDEQRRDDDPRD